MLPPGDKHEKIERLLDRHDKRYASDEGSRNRTLHVNKLQRRLALPKNFVPPSARPGFAERVNNMRSVTRRLDGRIASQSIQNGDKFPPNTKIKQIWTIQNSMPSIWPAGCFVGLIATHAHHTKFELENKRSEPILHQVGAGEEVNFSIDITVPKRSGWALTVWRLCTANGLWFGPHLHCGFMVTGSTEQLSLSEYAAKATRRERSWK